MPERLVDVEKQGSRVLHTFRSRSARPLKRRARSSIRRWRRRQMRSWFLTRKSKV